MINKKQFEKLISLKKIKKSKLSEFYCSLNPVKINQVKGLYEGGYWKTGSVFGFILKLSMWWGKDFQSQNQVFALVHQFKKQGKLIKLNVGKAKLEEKLFRNKKSTAMVYKYLPITDQFRKIDDKTLMGAMTLFKRKHIVLYFYLKKV